MSFRIVALVVASAAMLSACSQNRGSLANNAALDADEAVIAMAMASHASFKDEAIEEPAETVTVIADEPEVAVEAVAYERRDVPVLEPVQPMSYPLDTGDQIRVFVYGQPNLSRIYAVDGGGYISMPLINAVKVRGITTFAAERLIAHLLSREYVREPMVSIEVTTYRPVFIMGEVRSPGQFAFAPGLTSRRLIALAGGYTPRAKKHDLSVTRVLEGYRETHDIRIDEDLLPGDVITVAERWF